MPNFRAPYQQGYRSNIGNKLGLIGKIGELNMGQVIQELKNIIPCRFLAGYVAKSAHDFNNVQIDYILLSQKGFFCIEVKNWSGVVYCDPDPKAYIWETSYNGVIKKPKNPLLQNQWHCNRMHAATGAKYNNLVVFSDSVTLTNNIYSNVLRQADFIEYMLSLPDIYGWQEVQDESFRLLELEGVKE